MKTAVVTLICAALLPLVCTSSKALPAFPGAEGFGSQTPGGRGGRVIEVTNLNDSGPGSLRAAVEASGPRIVVFRVGGTIALKHHLIIMDPFITIAGQTAPGEGILLRDAGLKILTHDVVIRFLRVRVGPSRNESDGSLDGLHLSHSKKTDGTYNIVADHCSFSWAVDENGDAYGKVSDYTIQWCIFSEGLRNSIHHKGGHSMGLLMGRGSTRGSIHHNLLAHNNSRNPRLQGGRRDVVNNVFYNWGGIPGMFSDDPEVNFVGNYYKPGPDSSVDTPMIVGDNIGKVYLQDNRYPGSDLIKKDSGGVRVNSRFYAPMITTLPVSEVFETVVNNAGCTVPKRDSVDERIVREVKNGSGKIIDNPDQVGGFPVIGGGAPPSDRDHDGMRDEWEKSHGLNPDDPSDASKDRDGDGYTNIEEYINGLARR